MSRHVYVVPGRKVFHLFEECVTLRSRGHQVRAVEGVAGRSMCKQCAVRQRNEAQR